MTPDADIISTLLEDTPPPPPPLMDREEAAGSEIVVAPPPAPPLDMCDFLPPPPVNPVEENHVLEPALSLETGESQPTLTQVSGLGMEGVKYHTFLMLFRS